MKKEATVYVTAPDDGELSSSKEQYDARNILNRRNIENVNLLAFNCGGYALETYNWFVPIKSKDCVRDNAEEKWLISNGYETYWDCWNNDEDFKEMGQYIHNKVEIGKQKLIELVSEIQLPKGTTKDSALEDILCLYEHHDYSTSTALRVATLNMLKAFPDMREIKSWEELAPDEYGIAYKGNHHDFHFVKYDQLKQRYTHKIGFLPIKEVPSLEIGFVDYNSDTVYFAKKRKEYNIERGGANESYKDMAGRHSSCS